MADNEHPPSSDIMAKFPMPRIKPHEQRSISTLTMLAEIEEEHKQLGEHIAELRTQLKKERDLIDRSSEAMLGAINLRG